MLTPIHRPPEPWRRSLGPARRNVAAVLVHPDGRVIAAETDGSVVVWDPSGRLLRHLPTVMSAWELDEARRVYLQLHPDGVRLFSTVVIIDTSDVTHCWNLDDGSLVDRYEYPKVPGEFVGNELALTAHGLYLTLWDLTTGDTVREQLRDDASWNLFGMLDDDHALLGGRETFEVWNVRDGRRRWLAGPGEEARAAAIAGDAVAIAAPGRLIVRGIDGSERRFLPCSELTLDAAWSLHVDRAATTAVIAGAATDLLMIDLATGAIRARLPQPRFAEVSIAERDVIVRAPIEDVASVHSLADGRCRLRVPGEIALAVDGEVAVTSDGANVRVWAVDGRDHSAGPPAWTTIAVAAVPDVIVALDRLHHVHLLDPAGTLRHSWGPTAADAVLGGARLAYSEGPAIVVVDATTGEEYRRIETKTAARRVELFAGGAVIGAVIDGEIQLWKDTLWSRFRARDDRPELFAFDGGRVAVSADKTVELWRAESPLRLHTFRSLTYPRAAAFDPSGRWLVTGHDDGALLVRDTAARAHHTTLETQLGPIRSVAIGQTFLAACGTTALAIWDIATWTDRGTWGSDAVTDIAWLDDTTLACATERGLVLLRA